MLPKLFIGSSDEAQKAGLLDALRIALESGLNSTAKSIELVPWPDSPWGNLKGAVDSLVENLVDYSYGVFILSADDELSLRDKPHYAARDNVIFEFGLFLAHLGPERTFLVAPNDIEKTIPMWAVKTTAKHTKPIKKLPLRILTDLSNAYRKGKYTIVNPGAKPEITFQINDVIAAIKDVEATTSSLELRDATLGLAQRLLTARSKSSEPGKGDAYYSGQFSARFRDIATLKAQATEKSVQNTVQDLLLYLELVPDLCDISQLAREQHHSKGVGKVWVFSDDPLEFRAVEPDAPFQELRTAIIENLRNGVEYVYFVGPKFHENNVNNLVPAGDADREMMLNRIHVIIIHPQCFSTYFTLHFGQDKTRIKSVYMSSVMQARKDLLIQVSDDIHKTRIHNCISVLGGIVDKEQSPRITRHVLPH